jgi:polyferredoxin
MLDEGSAPPADRERLTQIRNDTLQITRRIQRLRTAVLMIWIAIGLLVLGVAAIAAAVTARSEALGFTALALVLAGVAVLFTCTAYVGCPAGEEG